MWFTMAHAIFSSLSGLAFLVVRWQFTHKYLMVSREMPGLFRGEVANYEQTGRYKFWKLIISIIISLVTMWNTIFTFLWLMQVQEDDGDITDFVAFNFMASYLSMNLVLPIIPVVFFGIALKRIYKFARGNDDKTLIMNETMFKIHMAILAVLALSSLILAITFLVYFSEIAFWSESNF